MAFRLKSVLPELVLANQTAFVKDRLLLENVLLASEVIRGYHKVNGPPRITLKVDISKAFDSVRWDFVLACLQSYNFPVQFVNCVRACICSPAFSISLNGTSSGFFKGKTGLRQGDPLSPALFVLVINVLSHLLNKAAESGLFGYHPGCEDLKLTHLSFADDLLIFIDGTESSLKGVLSVLSHFEEMSGLAVNIQKTSMFSASVSADSLQNIEGDCALKSEALPIRYLGLPLCSRRLSISDCDPLITQIKKKLNSWTHRTLSIAGRYTLLSSAITGIVGFWTSAFILPKRVIKKINCLTSAYLWHGSTDTARGAKVSWDNVCLPKLEGGLGLRKIWEWNQTCGLKLVWMLFFRSGSLWVAWVWSKYLSNSPFWALNDLNYKYSWLFRKLLKLRHHALKFIRVIIGNGDDTFFWWDPWTPFGTLYHYLGSDGPSRLGIPLFATVSDLIKDGSWIMPNARSERQLNLLTFMTTCQVTALNDKTVWRANGIDQKKFISKTTWNCIRTTKQPVPWAKLIWHKARIPRHSFTTWLFVLNRNPTLDRLSSWGCDLEQVCLLCGAEPESRDHLFFNCEFSIVVWNELLSVLQVQSLNNEWTGVLNWLLDTHHSSTMKLALLQAWQGAIYQIWAERNRRFHDGITFTAARVFHITLQQMRDRARSLQLQNDNYTALSLSPLVSQPSTDSQLD